MPTAELPLQFVRAQPKLDSLQDGRALQFESVSAMCDFSSVCRLELSSTLAGYPVDLKVFGANAADINCSSCRAPSIARESWVFGMLVLSHGNPECILNFRQAGKLLLRVLRPSAVGDRALHRLGLLAEPGKPRRNRRADPPPRMQNRAKLSLLLIT